MSKNLSDRSGTTNKASIVARTKQYSDLDLNLTLHPVRKDIIPLRDDMAVKSALRNLIVSNFYERPFNAMLGANLRALLFEPADNITQIALRSNIERVIRRQEPRVDLYNIEIEDLSDENKYQISIFYNIKAFDTDQTLVIQLRRLK
jgi:phage baseplate assembly protein W